MHTPKTGFLTTWLILYVLVFQPTTTNNMGTLNNIVQVKRSDFEVFEALAIDSISVLNSGKHKHG